MYFGPRGPSTVSTGHLPALTTWASSTSAFAPPRDEEPRTQSSPKRLAIAEMYSPSRDALIIAVNLSRTHRGSFRTAEMILLCQIAKTAGESAALSRGAPVGVTNFTLTVSA